MLQTLLEPVNGRYLGSFDMTAAASSRNALWMQCCKCWAAKIPTPLNEICRPLSFFPLFLSAGTCAIKPVLFRMNPNKAATRISEVTYSFQEHNTHDSCDCVSLAPFVTQVSCTRSHADGVHGSEGGISWVHTAPS